MKASSKVRTPKLGIRVIGETLAVADGSGYCAAREPLRYSH